METIIKTEKRESGLDAPRGFAILTMVLSGIIPYRVLHSRSGHTYRLLTLAPALLVPVMLALAFIVQAFTRFKLYWGT